MKRLGKRGHPESLHTFVEFLKTIKETLKEKKVVEDMEPLQTVKFAHHHNTVHSNKAGNTDSFTARSSLRPL